MKQPSKALNSEPLCAHCGAPAQLEATSRGTSESYCAKCMDLVEPTLGLGGLKRHLTFVRRVAGPCPHCGSTAAELEETALVGCPLCYEALPIGR